MTDPAAAFNRTMERVNADQVARQEAAEPRIVSEKPPPLCVSCCWKGTLADRRASGLSDEVCARPVVDLVSGAVMKLMLPCRDERRWGAHPPESCGREGYYYQEA